MGAQGGMLVEAEAFGNGSFVLETGGGNAPFELYHKARGRRVRGVLGESLGI